MTHFVFCAEPDCYLLLRVAKRREGNEFRAGPSRSETGDLTRRSADVKTDEELLSEIAVIKGERVKFKIFAIP